MDYNRMNSLRFSPHADDRRLYHHFKQLDRDMKFYDKKIVFSEQHRLSTIRPYRKSEKERENRFYDLKRDILRSVSGPRDWRPYPKLLSNPYGKFLLLYYYFRTNNFFRF